MRTNLQFIDVASTGGKAFVVTSAGPSEGKSMTSANLAIALAEAGVVDPHKQSDAVYARSTAGIVPAGDAAVSLLRRALA